MSTKLGRRLVAAWHRLWAGIVQDCPPELGACETCRELDCTEAKAGDCERRIAAIDAIARERAAERNAAKVRQ